MEVTTQNTNTNDTPPLICVHDEWMLKDTQVPTWSPDLKRYKKIASHPRENHLPLPSPVSSSLLLYLVSLAQVLLYHHHHHHARKEESCHSWQWLLWSCCTMGS